MDHVEVMRSKVVTHPFSIFDILPLDLKTVIIQHTMFDGVLHAIVHKLGNISPPGFLNLIPLEPNLSKTRKHRKKLPDNGKINLMHPDP